MKSLLIRLASAAAAVLVVASCDSRLPTQTYSSTTSFPGSSVNPGDPTIAIDAPLVNALVNVGDSILVSVRVHDDAALASVELAGFTVRGSVDLGTITQTIRYSSVGVPVVGVFHAGLRDTSVRRYLTPVDLADTTVDSLVIRAIVTNTKGNKDTATKRISLVSGPKVSITSPITGDSIPAGVSLGVAARAVHPEGINRIDIRVQGEASWPTKLDTTVTQVYSTSPRDIVFSASVHVPIDAPVRSRLIVSATALDVNRQPGSALPVTVFVRSGSAAQPRVTQTVSPKSEISDSVIVRAVGEGIRSVGFVARDSAGGVVKRDSIVLPPPYTANVQLAVPLNLQLSMQGKRLGITAFAVDQAGRTGYAVKATQLTPEGTLANGLVDSALIVHGRTFPLPHGGVAGDVVVDANRGNVFLSNTSHNLLELWQSSTKSFYPNGIPVGSLPWGMFVSNNPDTLLVANSGGTNISRVFIGSTSPSSIREDLANRILTRNTYNFILTVQKDENTGKIRLSAQGPISYSDRPQYLAQARGGRIYYSTQATTSAPTGTIRWLDPSLPVPDPRQVWQYGTIGNGTDVSYALFNIDSIAIGATSASSLASDTLYVWDHPYGQSTGVVAVRDTIPLRAIAAAVAGGSDAEAILRLDIASLGLGDTTFIAASGNRNWVAFGEGHTSGPGRIIMVADSTGSLPNFFSPLVTVSDLTDNADEQVFGLAIDLTGATVAAHGNQSYFAGINEPFHLRLQGKYDSFDNGAGIAFHPAASGLTSAVGNRLAFVGSAAGQIEIVDIAYYVNRGKLQLKNPIYGPLRVSMPLAGDPPEVVLKLFAVSAQGLIVIDLTANDIKPGP
jgi:hypothetical protein